MNMGIRLWFIWLLSLIAGVYGTSLVYSGITSDKPYTLIYGLPTLLVGIWMTGNLWASARQFYRKNRITKAQRIS
ncbi:hypothetical protein [Ferroacidibacillus organovorans]|uniref:Uncharacterized protein n=1 Tax=Ferroacidibacillus organovorans TaxID=1765683 RepID=A0A162UAU7_9BACL|nr:hypothetical protein [Ferroacidibacillus organovorans]KYP81607.1 hypothetical protein AYJ22_06635 [Ferroacidibacillus organovorans]OAG94954.1 hypothetical protein AYW79_02915 [Ferroacidibacillus organovorans]OPG14968.1 hypothetical protein B2M26_14100 [Ferroacidibacillus organovorans]